MQNPTPILVSSPDDSTPDDSPGSPVRLKAVQSHRDHERFVAGQRDAFELAMKGEPIITVLNRIVRIAWELFDADEAARAAIFTVDADGKHLRFGVAAEMADAYTRAVDGMEIGLHNPSCGTVAFTGETVIVADVDMDPQWLPYLPLAQAHEIRACWSFPIRAVGGKVLGTLAIYHRLPREPEPRHLSAIGLLAQTAAVILERHKMTEEHLRAVEQMRHNHNAFFNLIQNARFGLYVVDAQFRMRHVSAASQKVFSNIHPLIGRDFAEILRIVWAEPFASEAIGHFHRTLETGEPYASPNTTAQRGSIADVESYDWNIERVILPNGQFGVVCYFYDISERVKAADALRRSEARFRALFNEVPVAIYSCDREGLIDEVNPLAIQLWGRTPVRGDPKDRFCGSHKAFLPDGTYMSHEDCPVGLVLNGTVPAVRDAQVILERPDGSKITVMANIIPLKNDAGEITGVMNCFYDITERKQVEEAIQESKRFLGSSLDAMTSNITVLDENGVILAVNESWRKFADQNRYAGDAHGVGTNYLDACGELCPGGPAGSGGPSFAQAIRDVISGNRDMFEAEYPCHSPTERRWFLMQVTRFQGPGPTRVVIVHENITARKHAEDALTEARRAAETANEAKDKFLAVLSHELRTPLTPVLMIVSELETNQSLSPSIRADLKMVCRNVELEVKLIDDLLDISRITSGKLHLALGRVDINDLLRHVCDMCRSSIQEKGIRLHRDLDGETSQIIGDPSRLHQVFWNLLNNAVKFTPEGGDIYVTARNIMADNIDGTGKTAWVRASVRDTGRGIAPKVLPRIFDAFEQGDEHVTRQFGGLGLGLAISKKLVDSHHGSIRAQTDGPDKGSTFIVELPAAPLEKAALMPEEFDAGSDFNAMSLRVLVVEDHADTARILARLMTSSGHTVKTATTGAAALALAGQHVFDLVVSDLGLPDVTGYDLMRQLQEKYGTKGIAMSGNAQDEDIKKSGLAGFSEHLVKPVNFSQLDLAMRRVAAKGLETRAGGVVPGA